MGLGQRPPDRNDWLLAAIRIGLFTVVLIGTAAVLLGENVPVGWLIWIVVTVLSVGWLINWHTRTFGYQCPKCSHAFGISRWTNMVSPNIVTRAGPSKLLRCPNCQQRSWCPVRVLIGLP